MKALRYTCAWLIAAAALGAAACAGQTPEPSLTAAQRMELETSKAQLSDPARTAKTKREAALLLLIRPYPQATAALRDFLADETNRPAQIAVAEAVAQSGQTHKDFVKPLLAMLTGGDPSVRGPAANALAAYKDHGALDALVELVLAPQTERDTRLVVISAMQRILDKKAIDVLVRLLNDPDETIRNAACDSLTKLTSIRAFGRDRLQWRSWWSRNRDKPRSTWVADLAESLGRAKLELGRENAGLRRRLAETMEKLYATAPPGRKDVLLGEMLKDPLPEIRLVGVHLARQRVTGSAPPPEPLGAQVRALVADANPAVRRAAAMLLADIRDPQAVKLLTARLEGEQAGEVREAIYQALGLLREPALWDQLVTGLAEPDWRVAAAAASALAQVAEKNATDEGRRDLAVEALKAKYAACEGDQLAGLREALLSAMGALKDKRLAPLMTAALKDPAATVRLSAVKGLQLLGLPESAVAVAGVVGADADRGVRLAAILALGSLGGAEHLDSVLARTDARVEGDAAVREQAWSVVMSLLVKADTVRLAALADQLQQRPDAGEYLIRVLKLWAERVPAENVAEWAPIRQRLGEALLGQARPVEAAGELARVHAALAKAGDAQAERVWLLWVEALLGADDASAAARIAETEDEEQFAAAAAALLKRLEDLKARKDWDASVRLGEAAHDRLAKRLPAPQREALEAALSHARQQRQVADRQRVAELAARLTSTDATARAAAGKELLAMKDRAAAPLVAELRKAIAAEKPHPDAEKAITAVISALAPQLKGYDPQAPQAERIKTLDGWLKQLGS